LARRRTLTLTLTLILPPPDALAAGPQPAYVDRQRLRTPHLPQGAPTSGALAHAPRSASIAASPRSPTRSTRPTRATPTDDLVLSGPRSLARAASTIVGELGAMRTTRASRSASARRG
jgi:hypothetical protein